MFFLFKLKNTPPKQPQGIQFQMEMPLKAIGIILECFKTFSSSQSTWDSYISSILKCAGKRIQKASITNEVRFVFFFSPIQKYNKVPKTGITYMEIISSHAKISWNSPSKTFPRRIKWKSRKGIRLAQ
jgi:hypothetical protein